MTDQAETAIKPAQVRIGVYVRIPVPWVEHSFLTSSFLVTSERQVQEILALGVDVLYDRARSKVAPTPLLAVADAAEARDDPALQQLRHEQAEQVAAKQARLQAMAQTRARLDAVQKSFSSAADTATTSFAQLGGRPRESVAALRDIAHESTDTLVADPASTILMVTDKAGHHAQVSHAISVMTLAVLVAKHVGLPEIAIKMIGMGALLHDVGVLQLNPSLVRVPVRNKFEEAAYRTHCQRGYQAMKALGALVPHEVLSVILMHHEHEDGSGYPLGRQGSEIPLLVKLVAMADHFDRLTNAVDARHALSPFEAIAVMWARERHRFDDALLQHFIRAMGVYPPGTLVQLSDGRVGVVVAAAPPDARLAPQVLVHDPATPRREAVILDLADPATAATSRIEKALRAQERSEEELDYLLPRRRIAWFRAE